jgi:hypothetical protein
LLFYSSLSPTCRRSGQGQKGFSPISNEPRPPPSSPRQQQHVPNYRAKRHRHRRTAFRPQCSLLKRYCLVLACCRIVFLFIYRRFRRPRAPRTVYGYIIIISEFFFTVPGKQQINNSHQYCVILYLYICSYAIREPYVPIVVCRVI